MKTHNSKRSVLPIHIKNFLKYYFHHICEKPTLDEMRELAVDLEVEKENIYWWFANQRARKRSKDGGKKKHRGEKNLPSGGSAKKKKKAEDFFDGGFVKKTKAKEGAEKRKHV